MVYKTEEKEWYFDGEYIGKRWHGVAIVLPQELDHSAAVKIAAHLVEAMKAMANGYVILHARDVEVIPDTERESAIVELNAMGFDIEALPNGAVRQTKRPGTPKLSREEYKKQATRMMKLIGSVREKRRRYETLAKSEEL